jgi:hypothetical protein
MCWNKETSFITLLIGTLFNIILVLCYPKKEIIAIALLWEFVLLMQLFEGLSWISKETKDKNLSDFSTKSAFFSNILQPVVVCIAALVLTKNIKLRIFLLTLIISYITYCVIKFKNFNFDKPLYYDTDNCKHLRLYWWDFDNSNKLFIFYMILLILGFLSFPTKSLAVLTILYIVATLLLSRNLYPCSTGSLWCWFAAFAPIYTIICLKVINY